MDVWWLVLYTMAALLALRSLSSLMTAHRQVLRREHAENDSARRQSEKFQGLAEQVQSKAKKRQDGAAA